MVAAKSAEIKYPITVRVEVLVHNETSIGTISNEAGFGCLPTHEEVLQAIASAKAIAAEQGFKVPETPQEFVNLVASEMYGTPVLVPINSKEFCYTDDQLPPPKIKAVEVKEHRLG